MPFYKKTKKTIKNKCYPCIVTFGRSVVIDEVPVPASYPSVRYTR